MSAIGPRARRGKQCRSNAGTTICVSSYLLHMCPHTAIYVSSYSCVSSYYYMSPYTAIYVSSYCYICVLILLYVSSYFCICVRGQVYSRYCYVCVLTAMQVLLYVYEDTYIVVWGHIYSRYCNMCVPKPHICGLIHIYMWPHTHIYVASYTYICGLIHIYNCL
jgi:hypothetical protein